MKENINNTNDGICCDVCECVHNINGCNCNAKTIKVTKGETNSAHFCKTYANKEKLNDYLE